MTETADLAATPRLASQQRTVRAGILLGTALFLAIGGAVYALAPLPVLTGAGERLAYALRFAPISALMLLLGVGVVGNTRFATPAIDPLAGAERGRMLVYGRYLTNTLEQLVSHLCATLGFAALGGVFALRMIPALTACFVVGRLLFLFGYLSHPLRRAPGFTMTVQPTLFALLYLVGRGVLDVVLGA